MVIFIVLGCFRLFQVVQLLKLSWFVSLFQIMSGWCELGWIVLVILDHTSSPMCFRPLWFVILFQNFSWFYVVVDWLKLLEIVSGCAL